MACLSSSGSIIQSAITSEHYLSACLKKWNRWLIITAILTGSLFFAARIWEIPQRSALRGWDNSFYLFWVRSAWLDGDFDFQNEIAQNNTIAPENLDSSRNLTPTDTGLIPNKYGIGWGIASLPFFILADATTMVAQSVFNADVERDGFSPIYQIWLQIGHLLYALVGLYALYVSLKTCFSKEISSISTAILWLASPLIYYQSINLSMAHSLVFSSLALLLAIALKKPESSKRSDYMFFGAIAGLCLVTRYQTLPLIAVPFVWLLIRDLKSGNLKAMTNARNIALITIAAAIPVIIQLIAWKIVYGHWLIFTYGENAEGFRFLNPQVIKVLFSAYNGLFYWHPILLPAFAGLIAFAWKEEKLFLFAVFAFLLTIYINSSWWAWHFAASFGHRGFVGSLVFLAFGIAWILKSIKTTKSLHICLSITSTFIAWNILLCLLYAAGFIDRNGPVSPSDILHALHQLFIAVTR